MKKLIEFINSIPKPDVAEQAEAERQRERTARAEHTETLEWLRNVAATSLKGGFGRSIQDEAKKFLLAAGEPRRDEETLRSWLAYVRRQDWASFQDPGKRIPR